ncbi:MAG TPA: M56 family metallopeptidase, partial [Acidobacteriaceae bacterium]|nr:M56 family metallopeptidase [Acidobacteriaceae bacterium]
MTDLTAMAPAVQNFAQILVERVLNSLPEGLLLAGCAWLLLRLLGKQNAGTRFAVWLVTLVGVAGLPLLSAFEVGGQRLSVASHAEVTVSAFWAVLFAGFWILIALVALARLAAGLWQVRAISAKCTAFEVEKLDPALQEVFAEPGKRRVRLLISESARVPAAIGFRKPAIVLPAWTLRELSPAELKPILIHEMAHLRRRDDWTNLLQKTVRAVLFFHPAVWWIDARLSM